ncbi:MAG: hypothetical protein QOF76_5213 [Solirubrobacteraceae bacterium]|jgi:Ca2+-binding RTX toxin-like protein|nr:hypothetical protein [Solirubrobacteraceae bacterium]
MRRITLLSLLFVLAAAAPAGAANLSYSVGNSIYLLKGGAAAEKLVTGATATGMSFTGTGLVADATATGAGECVQTATDGAETTFNCTALVVRVIVRGGGGNDEAGGALGDAGISVPLRVYGGPGNDTVIGGPKDDTLEGDEGNDVFYPGIGADSVLGDCNTGLVCTNGKDTLDLSKDGRPTGVIASLAAGPEGGDVTAAVENLTGTDSDDILTGGPGANHINGLGGNDVLDSRDMSKDAVDCGDGSDTATADSSDVLTDCETPDVAPRVRLPKAGTVETGRTTLNGRRLSLGGTARCARGGGRCKLVVNVAGIGHLKKHIPAGASRRLRVRVSARVAGVLRKSGTQRPHILVLLSRSGAQTVKREYDSTVHV